MGGVDENGKPIYIDASIGYERPKKGKDGKIIKDKKGKPVMEKIPPRKPSKSSTQKPRGGETIWRPKGKK